jgi:hypothetical protein
MFNWIKKRQKAKTKPEQEVQEKILELADFNFTYSLASKTFERMTYSFNIILLHNKDDALLLKRYFEKIEGILAREYSKTPTYQKRPDGKISADSKEIAIQYEVRVDGFDFMNQCAISLLSCSAFMKNEKIDRAQITINSVENSNERVFAVYESLCAIEGLKFSEEAKKNIDKFNRMRRGQSPNIETLLTE